MIRAYTLLTLYTILFVTGSIAQISNKQNIQIERSKNSSQIVIKALSCDRLIDAAWALRAWTKRLGEHSSWGECKCVDGMCSLDITNIAPNIIREMQGVCPKERGPNCWNSSLVSNKILPWARYSNPDEMSFWLDSPLCKEREPNEETKPGDIIAIRANGREVHGFINLNKDFSFSKNGSYEGNPYSLQSLDNVFRIYKVSKDCQRVYKEPTSLACSKKRYANYFSCQSFEDYIKKEPMNRESQNSFDELDSLECEINSLAFNGVTIEDDIIKKTIYDSLLAVKRLSETNIQLIKKDDQASVSEEFFWESILVRVNSLYDQMGLL